MSSKAPKTDLAEPEATARAEIDFMLRKAVKIYDEIMEAGEAIIADPSCPESMKKMVRAEMEKHKECLEMTKNVLKSSA